MVSAKRQNGKFAACGKLQTAKRQICRMRQIPNGKTANLPHAANSKRQSGKFAVCRGKSFTMECPLGRKGRGEGEGKGGRRGPLIAFLRAFPSEFRNSECIFAGSVHGVVLPGTPICFFVIRRLPDFSHASPSPSPSFTFDRLFEAFPVGISQF